MVGCFRPAHAGHRRRGWQASLSGRTVPASRLAAPVPARYAPRPRARIRWSRPRRPGRWCRAPRSRAPAASAKAATAACGGRARVSNEPTCTILAAMGPSIRGPAQVASRRAIVARSVRLLILAFCVGAGCGGGKSAEDAGADAPSCTADCECPTRCCDLGVCRACGRPALGLCGGGERACPCIGGTCDQRLCCVLPDGTIDPGTGPACTASRPDGGSNPADVRP